MNSPGEDRIGKEEGGGEGVVVILFFFSGGKGRWGKGVCEDEVWDGYKI